MKKTYTSKKRKEHTQEENKWQRKRVKEQEGRSLNKEEREGGRKREEEEKGIRRTWKEA